MDHLKKEPEQKLITTFSYLSEIFRIGNKDDLTEIRCFHPQKVNTKPPKTFFLKYDDIQNTSEIFQQCLMELKKLNRDGYGIFFGVNPKKEKYSKKSAIRHTVCAHADFDIKPETNFKSLDEIINFVTSLKAPPNILVGSGGGIHAYWLFDETGTIEDAETINLGILKLCQENGYPLDMGTHDASRVMRLYPFKNTKYLDSKGPYISELKTSIIKEFSAPRYSINTLKESFPYTETSGAKKITAKISNLDINKKTKHIKKKKISTTQIENIVSFLSSKELSESDWFRCGSAIATHLQENGRRFFHDLSKNDPRYSQIETDEKYTSILKNNNGEIKIETLFFIAREQGCPENIREFLHHHYDYHYDQIGKTIGFKKKSDLGYEIIDDPTLNTTVLEAEDWGIQSSPKKIMQILNSHFTETINPVQDYLKSLKWDGKDYIAELAGLLHTKTPHTYLYLKRWLIATVNNVLDFYSRRSEICLILQGGQGRGKTQFFRNLICETSLQRYYIEQKINPADKDDQLKICSNWIAVLDELDGISNKSSAESMKQMLTSQEYLIRRPYGLEASRYRRIASFCGTVNPDQFLKDPTGNRRFLVIRCDDIDYEKIVSNDGLWAQAVALYNNDEPYWFSKEEIEEINKENSIYEFASIEFELIQQYYEKDIDRKSFLTTTEILCYLQCEQKDIRLNIKKIGEGLKKAGFERQSKRNGNTTRNGYYIKLKTLQEDTESNFLFNIDI